MSETKCYILVRTGGEYSDFYHYNQTVFLSREEADEFLASTNTDYNRYMPYCFEEDSDEEYELCEQWDKLNGDPQKEADYQKQNKAYHDRYIWSVGKIKDRLTDLIQSAECQLSDFERIELMANDFVNPHTLLDDAAIEEVEVKPGTRLYKLINPE